MRVWAVVGTLAVTSCSTPSPVQSTASGFEVEANGARAVVERTWTLSARGHGIGVFLGAVRCGETLLLADSNGGIRTMDLQTSETGPTLAADALAMSIAADCDQRIVYALGPSRTNAGQGRGMVLRGFDMISGTERVTLALATTMMPAIVGTVSGGVFVTGGLWMPTPVASYEHPPAPLFYRDKKIGIRVRLADGHAEPAFDPYDMACRGGGRCVGGSLLPLASPAPARWLASQPASREIALYDEQRRLLRRIDISSPLFKQDGRSIEVTDAEASMHWSTSNSLVKVAVPIGDHLVTIHTVVRLPAHYVFGQSVDFDWWMNVHSIEGQKLVSDIAIPGWPVGRDDDAIYAVDYGSAGRHSAPDSVKVLRMPVQAGSAGFLR